MSDDQIFSLAKAAGLARDWISANGKPMQVSAEALRAILEALNFPCSTDAQCQDSYQRLAALDASDGLPPLVTATVGHPIRLPGGQHLAGKAYRIELETGQRIEGRFPEHWNGAAELPSIDHYGYHRLYVGDKQTMLAVAPPRCFGIADAMHARTEVDPSYDPRLWGLGVQLYSLRRKGDGGLGDFTSLATLATLLASHGAAALAISPVHAMFSADITRFSPYGPSSRLFLNVLHIDPANILGQDVFATTLASLGGDAENMLARMEKSELINWPASASLRLTLLRRLYGQFMEYGEKDAFEKFRYESGTSLRDHARFEAVHAWRLAHGENGDWRTWPIGLRNPKSAEVERFAQEHAAVVRFHEFLQWQAARGLSGAQKAARDAGMPIGLIADLAVGADNGGSQAWSRQTEIINGLSVGAPPDVINTRGQKWGLGAFSPHTMKAQGFGAYIEMLRATFAYAGGARIDHVLGLSRLWLTPQDASPEEGAYLQYPMEDLLRLTALESWRHRAIVIGEDLGTVPAGFDEQLTRAGLMGMRVLLFQRDSHRFYRPEEWSKDAIATTTTHDLPTIAGWWQGRDIDWRTSLDLLEKGQSEEEAHAIRDRERSEMWQALGQAGCASGEEPEQNAESAPLDAAIDFMSMTPAPLAMLPVEDALGLVEQPNLPGTIDSHPNWRRRLPQTVDNILLNQTVIKRLAIMNKSRSCRGES
ncbi:MAG: 4-alpha-glucanotransferase [Burkholderiaceae bacterium]